LNPSGHSTDLSEGKLTPIQKWISFAAHNRLLVIALTAAAVAYSIYTMKNIRLDAIPDLSDTQVIVYTKWDRSPDIVEDQVTYPIITALLGAPKVKAIRGFSDFGFSYVYVIFQDGTDIYWARSRVLEYLQKISGNLPPGVKPELGPDATGVGWVYEYALVDKSGKHNLAELRTFQDWYLRYAVQSVPGVAEVAGIGGFQKQYQVTIDPNRLQNYGLSVMEIAEAIRRNNSEVGGRLIEWTGREYMVRARGYIQDTEALGKVVVKAGSNGTPVLLRDVATIQLGPQMRRGIADLDGAGDVVGGIVVMRHGENALNVIQRVKAKLEELKPSLPEGVQIVSTYDRSELIKKSIDNLKGELLMEMIIVSIVILLFLWHIPSALVPIMTIPISVTLAFIPMYFMGITSNIMSLAGISISIGVLVDGAIVEVENAYKKLERWQEEGRKGDFHKVRLEALMEVGPSVFFSLLVIVVSFLPVFTLVDQEGRLFKPLAYTKTLALALAALLAVTLDPAVRMLFARMDPFKFRPRWLAWLVNGVTVGKYYPEEKHPVSRVLFWLYEKPCRLVLRHPKTTIALAVLIVATTVPVYLKLGSEFMPPLNEGTILYMPTTLPGLSVTEAQRLMELEDRTLKTFPEVVTVFGKAGRADTSTDPAPFSMMETVVVLKPMNEWQHTDRFFSNWPRPFRVVLGHLWPEHISWEDLINKFDRALQIPGNVNAWTMPIKARIDMLSTGVRTPIGIKVFGADLNKIQEIGEQIESNLRSVSGTRSIYAERAAGGYFVDFVPRREVLARYGLTVADLQDVIMSAVGGENVSTTIEGRERYTINLRYPRDLRQDLDQLRRVLVAAKNRMEGEAPAEPMGAAARREARPPQVAQVPIGELADIKLVNGPSMIRDENGMLAGYVFVDIAGRDIGGYVEEAKRIVGEKVKLPTGYSIIWSGQYENMMRVRERLKLILPVTIVLIFLLLYMNTRSTFKALVVMLAVPFSLVGAVWLLYLLNYNISIAVWVGMIALMGLDAETGVFMLLFLDLSYEEFKRKGRLKSLADLHEAIIHGAVKRIRPKMMTVAAASMGLMPIMWSIGTGADMMKRVAAPMVGGLFTSFLMELLVYPAIYLLWKWHTEVKLSVGVQELGATNNQTTGTT
jgi:Cu(I)/Ag(I) efflux system membrane protein CusA/SilA